ncbi:MAG: aldehyde dehydrogenase family protein [Pseudomonadota bacterium]
MTFQSVTSLINGKRTAQDGVPLELIHPGDERCVGHAYQASDAQIELAVSAARRAFEAGSWRDKSVAERHGVLTRLADLIFENADTLGRLDCEDMGMPIQIAQEEARLSADIIRTAAQGIVFLEGSVFTSGPGSHCYSRCVPVGVVAAITPWNYPTPNVAYKVGPALALGNSVIIKPSEISPRSAVLVGELALQAGVPEGAIHILVGDGARVGNALAMHDDIDLISFTGSTRAGKLIQQAAGASNAKRVLAECGGKSPQIVFADIGDMADLAKNILSSAFANSGQLCVAKSRLLVERSAAPALLDAMAEQLNDYQPSDPTTGSARYGPLAFKRQFEMVREIIAQAQSQGAREVGKVDTAAGEGFFVPPTVFACDDALAPALQEEIFGPVLSVQCFDDEGQAIAMANDTRYGLSACVWTRDLGRAHRMADRLEAGSVEVNALANPNYDHDAMAQAGEPLKQSGFGVEGGIDGIKAYGALKSFVFRS